MAAHQIPHLRHNGRPLTPLETTVWDGPPHDQPRARPHRLRKRRQTADRDNLKVAWACASARPPTVTIGTGHHAHAIAARRQERTTPQRAEANSRSRSARPQRRLSSPQAGRPAGASSAPHGPPQCNKHAQLHARHTASSQGGPVPHCPGLARPMCARNLSTRKGEDVHVNYALQRPPVLALRPCCQ